MVVMELLSQAVPEGKVTVEWTGAPVEVVIMEEGAPVVLIPLLLLEQVVAAAVTQILR
jgi:hypothetical protein